MYYYAFLEFWGAHFAIWRYTFTCKSSYSVICVVSPLHYQVRCWRGSVFEGGSVVHNSWGEVQDPSRTSCIAALLDDFCLVLLSSLVLVSFYFIFFNLFRFFIVWVPFQRDKRLALASVRCSLWNIMGIACLFVYFILTLDEALRSQPFTFSIHFTGSPCLMIYLSTLLSLCFTSIIVSFQPTKSTGFNVH